jgi:hypothetical protein
MSQKISKMSSVVHERAKAYAARRHSVRDFSLSASNQFLAVFIVTLGILLYANQFVNIGGPLILQTSFAAVLVTAFGLNASKLAGIIGSNT